MRLRTSDYGSVLVTCMLVLVILSSLAVGLAGISGANLQIAQSQREASRAFANAESGLEVMRYWLSRVQIPSSTPASEYLSKTISAVQADLQANGVTNFVVSDSGSIGLVALDTLAGQVFMGQWSSPAGDPGILKVAATGKSGGASRTVTAHFRFEPYRFPIFNYGIAIKGPLEIPGSSKFKAAIEGWEADVYVESMNSLIAVDIGKNATFAGDIDIGNPLASISGSANLILGGEVQKVEEEDRPEFPVPDVQHFLQYATGPVLDRNSDFSQSSYTNAIIAPGTDPNFTADNVSIQGILYIKAPNKVMFSKIVTLSGIIVAEGDVSDPGTNQINFGDPTQPSVPSNFISGPCPSDAEFDALRSEVGSCILAPGFAVSFWKNFQSASGVIAASGLRFDKNANAKVQGTMIDYSEQPTVVEGNINLTFDRSAMVEIPAGFDLLRVPTYDPSSYAIAF